MASVLGALIAAFVALFAAWVTNFLAEDFRRFRDGSTLAAALGGELSAYEAALPMLIQQLRSFQAAVDGGARAQMKFRPIPLPTDPVYDSGISKIGLLGITTVKRVTYVYQNIRAFRVAFTLIHEQHADMDNHELIRRCQLCEEALQRAADESVSLLQALSARAEARYSIREQWLSQIAR